MTKSARAETPPSRFRVHFAASEPQLDHAAAGILLRILKQHVERTGAPASVELSQDDPTNHQQKDHAGE